MVISRRQAAEALVIRLMSASIRSTEATLDLLVYRSADRA
jgi:hypothetical protein